MEKRERVGGGQQLILRHMEHQAGVECQCLHSLSQNHVLYKTTPPIHISYLQKLGVRVRLNK